MTLQDGSPGQYWGGGAVLLLQVAELFTALSGPLLIRTIILAIIGATVGFLTQFILKFIGKKLNSYAKRFNTFLKKRKSRS